MYHMYSAMHIINHYNQHMQANHVLLDTLFLRVRSYVTLLSIIYTFNQMDDRKVSNSENKKFQTNGIAHDNFHFQGKWRYSFDLKKVSAVQNALKLSPLLYTKNQIWASLFTSKQHMFMKLQFEMSLNSSELERRRNSQKPHQDIRTNGSPCCVSWDGPLWSRTLPADWKSCPVRQTKYAYLLADK